MVMRSRGGGGGGGGGHRRGARTGGVRAVYEDFRPNSEWQQDDESHILNIYLPGFMKEQIKVTTEGRNTIRVRGERLVAGNKWSRFLEDFQVPENGEMNSVRAKFQGGVLNIAVPKKRVDKPRETLTPKAKSNDVHNQPATVKKDTDKVFPEINASQRADEESTQEQKALATKQGQDGDHKQTTPQKGQDKAFPAVGSTSQSSDEKSFESQKASDDYKKEHDQNSDQRDAGVAPFRNTGIAVSRDSEKEISEPKEKNIASDDLTSKMVNKEGKHNKEGTEELPEGETAKKTAFGKVGATDIQGKKVDIKESPGAITKEKYKKAVKGLAELNEERQLLVNMGVAMLVIVALTASVTYKFASGNDKN